MSNATHIKAIAKLLQECARRHDRYTVFSDCMEMMALAMSNAVDLRQRAEREARYLQIVKRYDPEVIAAFPKILGHVTMAMEQEPGDVLGSVFSQLELHNTDRGQFFTPFDLCSLMARLQLGQGNGLFQAIERNGFATVMEPACGAGAMVIAMAMELQAAGLNYQKQMHVTAIDIDARAAHMAYVQFSLLHIPATVIIGNALTLEEREHWYTPAHILGGWGHKLAEQNKREKPPVIQVPPKAPEAEEVPDVLEMPRQQIIIPSDKAQLSLF